MYPQGMTSSDQVTVIIMCIYLSNVSNTVGRIRNFNMYQSDANTLSYVLF